MLATGKNWDAAQTSLAAGQLPSGAVNELIDYLVFSGSGSTIPRDLGIPEVSVKLDPNAKGIGVKKDITDRVGVGYSLEQRSATDNKAPSVSQTLEGEVKVTDSLAVGVGRTFNQEQPAGQSPSPVTKDDKIMLKFKKDF